MPEKKVLKNDSFWIGLAKDILFVAVAVFVFASISQLALGTWTPMVAVESGSMKPHMMVGDIVFIQDLSRTNITTREDGKRLSYEAFNDFGDVILYKPHGDMGKTPIIHRAMYYVKAGDLMWPRGPPAPYDGYITKGDNQITNKNFDQEGQISFQEPVKQEWITGVARFRIPYIGCLRIPGRCFEEYLR